jgi:hypothetical protein
MLNPLLGEAYWTVCKRPHAKAIVEYDSPGKSPLQVEDLRKHTPEQIAELRELLDAGVVGRPDLHRPDFYEVDGTEDVYFILRYPSGDKVLLIAAWKKARH